MQRILILMSLAQAVALSALAQPPTPPSGFSIQITPSDSTRGAALQPAAPGEVQTPKKSKSTKDKTRRLSTATETSSTTSRVDVKATSTDTQSPVGARLRLNLTDATPVNPNKVNPPKNRNKGEKKRRRKTAKKSDTKKRRRVQARTKKKLRVRSKKAKKQRKRKARRKSRRRAGTKKNRKSVKKAPLNEGQKIVKNEQPRLRRSMSKRELKRALKSVKAELAGTGAPYSEKSRWGVIETLPMRVIAQIINFVSGPQQTFDATLDFVGLTTSLDADSQLKLIALADMLRENQAISPDGYRRTSNRIWRCGK